MFREMRRSDKMLTDDEMLEIMNNAEYGILSTIGRDGFPYGVPVNFVYQDGSIYFHSAVTGHKVDNMEFNNKVSFCVVTDVDLIPDDFNTRYKSVISFGEVEEMVGDEKQRALVLFLEKFSKDYLESGHEYIRKAEDKARVYKIEIKHMTAKGKK